MQPPNDLLNYSNRVSSVNGKFDFYGIELVFHDGGSTMARAVWARIWRDLSHFSVPGPMERKLKGRRISIFWCDNIELTQKKVFRFRGAQVYGWKTREVDYAGRCKLRLQRSRDRVLIEITSANPEDLYEVLWKTIHSQVGWELERLGWTRLHAAGKMSETGAQVLLADSGYGKTKWALRAVRNDEKIFSDELIWVDGKNFVQPWPIPMQTFLPVFEEIGIERSKLIPFSKMNFETKWQYQIPLSNVASPQLLATIQSPYWLSGLFGRAIVGIGLTQLLEQNFRSDTWFEIIGTAWHRARFMWTMWRRGIIKRVRSN